MSAFDALRYRLDVARRALFDREGWRREMDEELGHHLALEEMQQRHAGAPDDEARRTARRRFGDPRRVRERLVDDSGLSALDALRQDVRFAWRTLRARPGFTLVAVLTLAVGIGANVAIFSAVDAMLLRRLPFAAPEQLMKVSMTRPAHGDWPANDDAVWSYPKYAVFRDAQQVFSDVAIYTTTQYTVRGGNREAERVRGEIADWRYLPTLGLQPLLGRNFLLEEDREVGKSKVALISERMWQRRFAGDPAVLGKPVSISGEPYTIVGVLPASFHGLSGRAEFWVPPLSEGAWVLTEAWSHTYTAVGRRKPGVSEAQALEAVRTLGVRVDAAYPDPEDKSWHQGATARPLDATRIDPTLRRALLVLSGAVGLVLLITCANVANLLLVRAAGRRREIAVRIALGAGRGRLVRQLLTESVLLSAIGALAGLAVAWLGVRAIAALDTETTFRMQNFAGIGAVNFATIRLDGTALAFAAALAVGTGILFGLAPALQATRTGLTDTLKEGAAGSRGAGVGGRTLRSMLAVSEIAIAIVLLAGSGLMLRSLGKLLDVRPGVDPHGVLTMRFGARSGATRDSLPAFHAQVLARVRAVPGVQEVALQDCPALSGGCNGTALYRWDRPALPPGQFREVGVHWITPEWNAVMRVPLVRGRLFAASDRAGAPKVILINEAAAKKWFPGEDPIGRPVGVGQGGFDKDTATVVGIVGDVRYESIDSLPKPDVYLPWAQSINGRPMLLVRTSLDPLSLAAPIRRALLDVAPDVPVFEIRTMEDRVASAMAFQRFSTTLLALFAGIALALATLGVYGIVASSVAQRRAEIGVRMALGATRGAIVRLVVGQGARLALAGTTLGLVGAFVATRALRSMLYDVAPSDPPTFVGIVAVLALAVLLASWLPASRAASVRPTEALREG